MNLLLRTHENYNDPTWNSVIISIIILLIGTFYYIYTIMKLAFQELKWRNKSTRKMRTRIRRYSSEGHRIEDAEKVSEELRDRVRKLEEVGLGCWRCHHCCHYINRFYCCSRCKGGREWALWFPPIGRVVTTSA